MKSFAAPKTPKRSLARCSVAILIACQLAAPRVAQGCDLQQAAEFDVITTADEIALDAGMDIVEIASSQYGKTVHVYIDEFVKTSSKTGKTKFHVLTNPGEPELPRIHVFVYSLKMRSLKKYAPELRKHVNPSCPDNDGMDSPFGAGLMAVTILHEFFHVCIGESVPGGSDRWSCLHIAIDFGVHKASCDYVMKCLPAAMEDQEKREKLEAICMRLDDIESKINSQQGQQKILECTAGCDPSSSDPGYKPGNNICGSAFIPCPDGTNTTLACAECDQL